MAKARKYENPTEGLGPLDWEVIEEFEDDAYENLDYDEYERQCKLIEEENNQFLDEFYDDLVEAGLKAKTVSKHIDNLHFYLNTYLVRTAPLHMRAGCYKVGDYLGNFFIRKCMWSTPTSIKGNAASFKKFYKSMLKRGRITQDDYDCLASTIKCDMEYWCEDCAQFNDPYGDNPFSPFPSGFGGVGGALGGGLGLGGGSALGRDSALGSGR